MKILEVKRHLNKPDQSYLCDVLYQGSDHVVLKYVSDRAGRVGDILFEAGTTTYAIYRAGEGYVLWKMVDPRGKLKGHLFHICRDLQVHEDRVDYLDLLLDVWVDGDGHVSVLDRDELEACVLKGVVGQTELAWIKKQENRIQANWNRMIADFDHLCSTCPTVV
jgi:predicted RNA-binding protein associated with RNAse of E/G family